MSWWINIVEPTIAGILHKLLPFFICWSLWKAKNAKIFGRTSTSTNQIIADILCQIKTNFEDYPMADTSLRVRSFFSAGLLDSLIEKKRPRVFPVYWHPPSIGWFKLNCDGAFEGIPRLASGGDIITKNNGSPLAVSQVSMKNPCTVLERIEAQASALYHKIEPNLVENLEDGPKENFGDNLEVDPVIDIRDDLEEDPKQEW
ncbi:hypothetical protein ACH5RR_015294 [Cinchona calisaya]|uniref:Uncharacterized protein n=1 Tax=Cinchona calisaya TaxID=153742 RepID=A0ABD2ZVV0_9GENT